MFELLVCLSYLVGSWPGCNDPRLVVLEELPSLAGHPSYAVAAMPSIATLLLLTSLGGSWLAWAAGSPARCGTGRALFLSALAALAAGACRQGARRRAGGTELRRTPRATR